VDELPPEFAELVEFARWKPMPAVEQGVELLRDRLEEPWVAEVLTGPDTTASPSGPGVGPKFLLCWIIERIGAPDGLFDAFFDAAFIEPDPSYGAQFLDALLRSQGRRPALDRLIDTIEGGGTRAVTAATFLFIVAVPPTRGSWHPERTGVIGPGLTTVERRRLMLAFLRSPDPQLRSALIPHLGLGDVLNDGNRRVLAEQVVTEAAASPDERVRDLAGDQLLFVPVGFDQAVDPEDGVDEGTGEPQDREFSDRLAEPWVAMCLRHPANSMRHSSIQQRRKLRVAELLEKTAGPDALYEALLYSLLNEANISYQDSFARPMINSFGARPVLDRLVQNVRDGDFLERRRSASALYYVQARASSARRGGVDVGPGRSNDELVDLLEAFIATDDTHAARNLARYVFTTQGSDDPTVAETRRLALSHLRAHPDAFVRELGR
jgi:hypothetical protein